MVRLLKRRFYYLSILRRTEKMSYIAIAIQVDSRPC